MKTRAVQIFEQYINSQKTREQYNFLIGKFVKHEQLDSFDSILAINGMDLQKKIEDYIVLLKNKGNSSSYIRSNTFAIQSFCVSNDKLDVNWKKVRKLCIKTKPKKSRPYTTSEIKRMINGVKSLRSKALILFLSASGVRRGAITNLLMSDLKQMPNGCLAVTVYEGSNEEYVTFINKESSDALTLYFDQRKHNGEIINLNSLVFREVYIDAIIKPKKLSEGSITDIIVRAKINGGINFDNSPNLLCHAFRRRFNTILKLGKESNSPLIERLMGHDMKLDNSYFQPTLDDLFKEYCKGMADLTIDDSERLLAERKAIEEQRTEMEKQKIEQKSIKEQMTILAKNQTKMARIMDMIMKGDVTLLNKDNERITLDLTQN